MKIVSKSVLIDGNEAIREKTGLPYPKNHSRAAREREYPLESEEQQTVFEWARWNEKRHPDLAWLLHIPNGGLRNVSVAVQLKAEGTRKGFPDIMLPTSRHGYHSLAIELKRQKGARYTVSKEQKAWLDYLKTQGWFADVCHGASEAIERIEWYLN